MDNEKLGLITTLVEGIAADQKATLVEQKRLADALEVIATEQARIREDLARMGARLSRVEHANADLWQAIDRLRPSH
jgi:hypothetical protein